MQSESAFVHVHNSFRAVFGVSILSQSDRKKLVRERLTVKYCVDIQYCMYCTTYDELIDETKILVCSLLFSKLY